jgi:hypothetical protein
MMTSTSPRVYQFLIYLAVGILTVGFVAIFFNPFFLDDHYTVNEFGLMVPTVERRPQPTRYAYATFLSTPAEQETDYDPYFTATRALLYQLTHQPSTRTSHGYPLLVLVSSHVPEWKLRVLMDEGATIVPVQPLNPTNWVVYPDLQPWIDQISKLQILALERLDRILFLDSEVLLTKPLDDLFSEPTVLSPESIASAVEQEEAPPQQDAMVVGVADETAEPTDSKRNGRFHVARPCRELSNQYLSLLDMPDQQITRCLVDDGLLDSGSDENMPWVTLQDEHNERWAKRWERVQGRMEGYWQERRDRRDIRLSLARS